MLVSIDGRCGMLKGGAQTCQGSIFGDACSQFGWCGPTLDDAFSGHGCQEKVRLALCSSFLSDSTN